MPNFCIAGIEYLHSARPSKPALVHQNISADKVLLDYAYRPLISGCGLHKLLVDDLVFSTLKASAAMGYLAPEYTTVAVSRRRATSTRSASSCSRCSPARGRWR